ncbi:dTDP-4-dehydrorhamnose reductase family protein [Shewanella polaris]|uniref:SDR family oxidoreductase n=1 Tax=Shewanella polaris TaxID=2588449 RepID=A0A4Y5YD78_9GAMM|nr:SDR family oxidoreductase [Shewanella polaris]QDE30503.1 SDR family oxidoreductase [Shewanella polaris]
MKKLLLIGSNGLLGTSLVKLLQPHYELVTLTRTSPNSDYNLDMTSKIKCSHLLAEVKPDLIVNLAALTNVDACEYDLNFAYQVNTRIAENISAYSNHHKDVFVVHISTDHIYDADNSTEEDVVITNNYAMTKYCGEKSFKSENVVILRTNFFGKSLSESSEGLCNSIYKLVLSNQELNLFNDVFFSPLSIHTLCDVILICLQKKIPGVFNVGSKGGMSKENFLKAFLQLSGFKDFKYRSISVNDIALKTARPKDMRMDVSLFEKKYNYNLPILINEIESVANEFKKDSVK